MDQDFEKRLLRQQNGPPISPIISVSADVFNSEKKKKHEKYLLVLFETKCNALMFMMLSSCFIYWSTGAISSQFFVTGR